MERRRLADILVTATAHVYINRPMATSRRRSILFQAATKPTQKKQPESRNPIFRLPILVNPSQTFNTAALPLRPAERSILFSEKSVRCPTARKARLVRTRRKKDAE